MKHTKGPWNAKGTRAIAGKFEVECSSKADAQLIAAAPELLEAATKARTELATLINRLQMRMPAFLTDAQTEMDEAHIADSKYAFEKLNAAIAKATNGENETSNNNGEQK